MSLEPGATVHIIGVGGAGMSGLALLLHEMGCVVSGSDAKASPVLDELAAHGVLVTVGHDALNGSHADTVLWSPAVSADNVELVAARSRGARLLSRGEVLAALAQRQRVIGLTGTHGKTTATSMMVHVMRSADRDDSRLLGAPVIGVGANGHYGEGDLLLEVDESYGTFALLSPFALGLLNVEADHLDHYGSLEALDAAFGALAERTTGTVVAWQDDPGVRRVLELVTREVVTVGTLPGCSWRVTDVTLARRSATFTLRGPDQDVEIDLRVTGQHNVANAAVVATLALALGVGADAVRRGLSNFEGAPRRFQYLGRWRGVDVYEDYAHLPGEIAATLRATRAAGYERIVALFQPHRVTRTIMLASSFATAFEGASRVIVTDIYSAGEANPSGVTGEILVEGIAAHLAPGAVHYAEDFAVALRALESMHDECDVVLLLGAGDIASIAPRLSGGLEP